MPTDRLSSPSHSSPQRRVSATALEPVTSNGQSQCRRPRASTEMKARDLHVRKGSSDVLASCGLCVHDLPCLKASMSTHLLRGNSLGRWHLSAPVRCA